MARCLRRCVHIVVRITVYLGSMAIVSALVAQDELDRVLQRLMALPDLEVADGFSARVLVPPGELYDPLFMRDHQGEIWMNDDGEEEGDKGSKIIALDDQGQLSTVIALGRLLPVIGFDIAPASFGPYEGEIFSLAQAEIASPGISRNHIIQRVDPGTDDDGELFCTLPMEGAAAQGIAGTGIEARFGPEGSPFSGRFFAITQMNRTIYQVASDGSCAALVTFDQETGRPMGLTFSQDGRHMLVSTGNHQRGTIARVRADGTMDTPLVQSARLVTPTGMAFAPEGFGAYGGQLFVATLGSGSLQMTHAPAADGHVYRITENGDVHLVASGLHNPMGVHFAGDRLWVSDINGDFIGGRRELPEGFVVEIRVDR